MVIVMKIISRKEAIKSNLKYYFTGKPCKHGHVSKRKSGSGQCYECNLLSQRKHYDNDKEKCRLRTKKYYAANKSEVLRKAKVYAASNKDKIGARMTIWREANRAHQINYALEYKKNNPAMNRLWSSNYRAKKIMATPSWSNIEKVESIYKEGDRLNMQVDHIVPLSSDIVCGLHCDDNLQLLTAKQNASKGNRHWPFMPEGN